VILVINPVVGCHYIPPSPLLLSQLQGIAALRPVPNYSAGWQQHKGVNNLPEVNAERWHWSLDCQSNTHCTTMPPRYCITFSKPC